jgi:chromosome segregation ATPase
MTSPIQLYEALTSAPDDKTRARIIAEAFERMEERYPEVKDLATRTALSETELRLQKEIEEVRKEIAEVEGRLRLEIEEVRKEMAGIHKDIAGLHKEIAGIHSEIADVRVVVAETKASILRWVAGLLAGQTAVIIAALFAIVTR